MTTLEEIKSLSTNQIEKKLMDLKRELLTAKLKASVSGYEKPHLKSKIRKEIARVKTFCTILGK